MPFPTLKPPFSERYTIEFLLGHGSIGASYYAVEQSTGRKVVLKHISFPEDPSKIDALIYSGAVADEAGAQAYYAQVAEDYRREMNLVPALAENPHFFHFEDIQIDAREEAVGYDLYLVSPYVESLDQHLSRTAMSRLQALNMAIDLCDALEDLRAEGYIHSNLKPENVYLDGAGHFMMGDLGLVSIENLAFSSLPDNQFSPYTAPELKDIFANLNETVDLYAVGMMLYRIYNGNHAPFEDEETGPITAERQRLIGTALPAPLFADYELAEILQKACAFDPAERYASPAELRQALTLYMQRNEVSSELIVPPIVTDGIETVSPEAAEESLEPMQTAAPEALDNQFVQHFSPDTEGVDQLIHELRAVTEGMAQDNAEAPAAVASDEMPAASIEAEAQPAEAGDAVQPDAEAPAAEDAEDAEPEESTAEPKKPRKGLIAAIIAVVVVILALAAGYLFLRPSTVSSFTCTEVGAESLTVELEARTSLIANLELVCADAHGNTFTEPYVHGVSTYTFDKLTAGTQYSIDIRSTGRTKLNGSTNLKVSTAAVTEILSFDTISVGDDSISLSLTASGPEPEEWLLQVEDTVEAANSTTLNFSGHEIKIANLDFGRTYVFTLLNPEGFALSGATTLTATTGSALTVTNFYLEETADGSATVAWQFDGPTANGSWVVSCTGTDYNETVTTDETSARFTGLTAGQTYAYTLQASGLTASERTSFEAEQPESAVSSLDYAFSDSGTLSLNWEGSDLPGSIVVRYTAVSTAETQTSVTASGGTATLSRLIPEATYVVELFGSDGTPVGGSRSLVVETPAPENYDDHGLSNAAITLYAEPDTDSWTAASLTDAADHFTKEQGIVFTLSAEAWEFSNQEEVLITYVVRSSSGMPVSARSTEQSWASIWTDGVSSGSLGATPPQAGAYTFEIYFNNQFLASAAFQITT